MKHESNASTALPAPPINPLPKVHAKKLAGTCDGLYHSTSEERNGYGENIY